MGRGAREFGLDLLARADVPVGSDEPHSLHVHDDRFWDRVISQRQLGFGEAYMDGCGTANVWTKHSPGFS
ncbi:MAG: hypothetical protein ACKOBT_12115 [Actinomycetota bacterium]